MTKFMDWWYDLVRDVIIAMIFIIAAMIAAGILWGAVQNIKELL